MLYDVFISHASEDKDNFVRELAVELQNNHIEVWYDEFSLKAGDSLRKSIDLGLSKSRFGLVVLSHNFFNKKWPEWELNGLVQRHLSSDAPLILPVWLNVDSQDIMNYSPSLADIIAIKAEKGIKVVAQELLQTIKPSGSTLIIARDILIEHDFETPVVTDDWWLDIIEYSGANSVEGTFQAAMGWGRWGFPLPEKNDDPQARGERLAWTAMQNEWQNNAEIEKISQITHPSRVHDFIDKQIGLKKTCLDFPHYLAAYAPQLTINGFGGDFEEIFDSWFNNSIEKQKDKAMRNERGGTGLTVNEKVPLCSEPLALRHSKFGFYEPDTIACNYVQGDIMGPPVKVYEYIDYIAWILSTDSDWLPKGIKTFLKTGMKEWAVWKWDDCSPGPFPTNKDTGKLANTVYTTSEKGVFKLTKGIINDITTRLEYSRIQLNLTTSVDILVENFLKEDFIGSWIKIRKNRIKRNS